ncbi:hypothetical protein Syun_004174 [Stephania yunnanensis]|uniref:Uncharacterized protein n=1 Tax=Stephania yunnanensis TaxID=152371 RepID=A0AAP0L2I9_9MAGN
MQMKQIVYNMLIVKSNEPIPSRTIGKTKTRLSENRKNKNKGTSSSEPSTTSGFNKPPSSAGKFIVHLSSVYLSWLGRPVDA